jgi:hypothetical protein
MLQPAFNQGRTLTTGDLFTRQHLEKEKKKRKAKEDHTSYTPSNTTAASVESAERRLVSCNAALVATRAHPYSSRASSIN